MTQFATAIPDNMADEWVMHTIEKVGKDLHNVITPAHPVFKMLEKTGGIGREPAGRAAVEDVMFSTAERATTLTQNSGFKPRDLAPNGGITRAYFDIHLIIQDFVIDYFSQIMATRRVDMMDIVKQRLMQLDVGLEELLVRRLWNGHTEDGIHQVGIVDFCRMNPAADPAWGKLGRIGVADIPTWTNQAKAYNKAAITWDGTGGQILSDMLSDENGWLSLYIACSKGVAEGEMNSQPNLIPVNETMYLYLAQLQRRQLIVNDAIGTAQLGVDAFRFQNALVYHDPDMPVDTANPTKGFLRMLNTKSFKWKLIDGLEKKWDVQHKMSAVTGYQKDRITGVCMTVNNPRLNGVFSGVTAPANAA